MREPGKPALSCAVFQTVVEATANAVVVLDGDDVVRYANPAAVALFGRPRQHLIGCSEQALLADCGLAAPFALDSVQTVRVTRADGSVVVASLGVSSAGEGASVGRILSFAPVSAPDLQLRALLDSAPEAIILIDETGCIELVNAVAGQLFGHAIGDMLGRNVEMLMPAPDRQAHDSYVARYCRTGERRIIGSGRVLLGQRADGSVFPMELHVGELYSAGRRLFSGFVRDLSTAPTASRRLQELQVAFQKSVRLGSMVRLTSALAHELNQPIASILNYTEAARGLLQAERSSPTGQIAGVLEKAAVQADRAGAIIRRIRQNLAEAVARREPVDLNAIVIEASALALSGMQEPAVRLHSRLGVGLGRVVVERSAIQEVIYNLLINAIAEMRHSERRDLSIETSADPAAGQAAVVISDTGRGLSPEVQARLHQPVMEYAQGNTGIGLVVSREIVESHGGRLMANNLPNGGASLRFTLPTEGGPTPMDDAA